MKKHRMTAFYIETMILVVVLVFVILILTRIFGMGKEESRQARILTVAVKLAENAAEAVSASESPEQAAQLLNENGNAFYEAGTITACYDMDLQPNPEGVFAVSISWEPEEMISGTLAVSEITVYYAQEDEPVYTIETSVFISEEAS